MFETHLKLHSYRILVTPQFFVQQSKHYNDRMIAAQKYLEIKLFFNIYHEPSALKQYILRSAFILNTFRKK